MKSFLWAAAAVSFVVPGAVLAGGHDKAGGPPPGVVSKMNLGGAGLMIPFYANSQKGVTSGRGGRDSTRIGTAAASGVPTGFEHDTRSFLPSISLNKALQGGASTLTFSLGTNISNEEPNRTQNNTRIPGFSIGYENFSNPNAAWSVTATYEERSTESQVSPVETGAENLELRFAYIRKLSDTWGIANQTYLTFGETFVTTPGGTTTAKETEFYTQFEVVGSFNADMIGEGWKLHPIAGVSYQTANVDEGGVTSSAQDGSIWAKAVFAKSFRPGVFVPNVTLGIEHVYQSTNGTKFIDEDTFGIIGFGGQIAMGNTSFNVALEHRPGLNGKRKTTSFVTGISFDF